MPDFFKYKYKYWQSDFFRYKYKYGPSDFFKYKYKYKYGLSDSFKYKYKYKYAVFVFVFVFANTNTYLDPTLSILFNMVNCMQLTLSDPRLSLFLYYKASQLHLLLKIPLNVCVLRSEPNIHWVPTNSQSCG